MYGTKKNLFLIFLCFILITAGINITNAQPGEIVFNRFTKENGLAADMIHAVIKDHEGYYWLSSINGLQRFDGYRWVNFRHDEKDNTSLPDNIVYELMEDNHNRLWLNAGGYPCIYNPLLHTFKEIPVDYPVKKPFNIYALFQDSKGLIWMVSGPQGLFVLDTTKNIFRPYTTIWPPFFSKAFYFGEDAAAGRYWLATEKGCVLYDSRRKTYIHGKNNPDSLSCFKSSDFSEYCKFIYLDKNRMLWTYSEHPLKGPLVFQYDITKDVSIRVKKNEFTPVKYNTSAEPTKFITDQTGTTWAYRTKLWRYDSLLKEFFEVPRQPNSPYGIFLNWIYNMYEDADGTIWVMSDLGLYNFNPRLQYFSTLNGVWSYRQKKITNAETNGYLQTTNGHILSIGWSNDGIIFYDSTLKQVAPLYGFNPEDKKYNHANWYKCWAGLQDRKGIIWIGCQDGGIIQINPLTRNTIILKPPEFEEHTIRSITEDTDGNIWFGTQHSTVVKWVRSTNNFQKVIAYPGAQEDFGWMLAMVQGNKGDFWISTSNNGLLHVDMASGKITGQYQHDKNNLQSISNNFVGAIVSFNKDTMAIATGSGIDLFSIGKKTFSHISEKDGLPGGGITNMLADDKGNLWITTVDGIAKIHLPDKRIHKYGALNGVTENSFQHNAAIKLKDGRIVFGNTRGLVYFNPASIIETSVPTDVTISGFNVFDQSISVDSLFMKGNRVHLRYSENFITIQFASLGNNVYNKPVYYYKLEGINKDWVATQNPEAIYSYLPAGSFTFNVKCISPDGVPSKNITSFTIYIKPPFYQTWWFYLLTAALVSSTVYFIYRQRINKLLAVEKVRTKVARDLHDDMGSVLSTINILSTMAKTKMADDPVKSSEYIGKISDNSQRMMEAMDDIVWSIKPANDSMQKITARMREFATSLLEAKDIEMDFKVDDKIYDIKLNMEARRDFFLIFKEAVNNVAKYSRCNKCSVHISLHQHRLLLDVKDNGIGFDVSKADSGNGLSNMQKRAEALNGRVSIQSKPGEGTQITLNMPVI
jgi:ligand-binding sensor domain-containing protein/two-component sensor histidine kinase